MQGKGNLTAVGKKGKQQERLQDDLGKQRPMPSDLTNVYVSDIITLADYGPYALIVKARVFLVDSDWSMVDLMQGCSSFNEVQQKIRPKRYSRKNIYIYLLQ